MNAYVAKVLNQLRDAQPWEKEFLQVVKEVLESLGLVMDRESKYKKHKVLERLTIPERIVIFRVPWIDDSGEVQVNTGYRVQFNSAIGPYKGGLRFHPSVNLSVLKFLGFEQVFKNSLTGLPLGGAMGGSDFDPKGKSNNEVMRFCQNFMRELFRHIGQDCDIPYGDIGVGLREIGYLFGQYKMIANSVESVFTGKGASWGGTLVRAEATGYGCAYFAQEMLLASGKSLDGKKVMISGSGNVALCAAEKVATLGGKVVSLSDSNGAVIDDAGITPEKIKFLRDLKMLRRGRLSEFADAFNGVKYFEGRHPWGLAKAEIVMPCATENELNKADAAKLLENDCVCVVEGANMPSTPDAIEYLIDHKILFGPCTAASAGGMAASGLEMSQNAMRLSWPGEEVDKRLREIMSRIHASCVQAAEEYGTPGNYVNGANIAGFKKVADAMIELGV